jgi:hypothetical protein
VRTISFRKRKRRTTLEWYGPKKAKQREKCKGTRRMDRKDGDRKGKSMSDTYSWSVVGTTGRSED